MQVGLAPSLEPALGGKVLDTLIPVDGDYVYCEVIAPETSAAMQEAQREISELAAQLADEHTGKRIEVLLLNDISRELAANIKSDVQAIPISPDPVEIGAVAGIRPDDERMEQYWRLAEELDIPVGIHLGPGTPGEFYLGNRTYRARLQSALTLEETLIRHPRLRVYIMHAGYPFLDDLIALLFAHPQVYEEVSMLANVEPRAGFYRYLQSLVDAGYIDRIMFGSDQMVWPGLITAAIRSIEEAPFLTSEQKRDIFYNNAARFLRLSAAEIARHHRM